MPGGGSTVGPAPSRVVRAAAGCATVEHDGSGQAIRSNEPTRKEPVMSVPHEKPYNRRSTYQFRTELSGLERPRQWVRMIAAVLAVILVLGLVAFLAFG